MIKKIKKTIMLITLLLVLDQATKYLFSKPIDLGIIAITPIINTGISFGLFKNNNFLFIIIAMLIITLLIIFKKEFEETQTQYALILAGATGNLIDRIIHGHVLDFIDFKFFPVFNIADALIFLGVTSIIIYEITKIIKDKKIKSGKKIKKK